MSTQIKQTTSHLLFVSMTTPPQVLDPSLTTKFLRKNVVRSNVGQAMAFERRTPMPGCVSVQHSNRSRAAGSSALNTMEATGVLCANTAYAKKASDVITGNRSLMTLGSGFPPAGTSRMAQTGTAKQLLCPASYSQFKCGVQRGTEQYQHQLLRKNQMMPYESRAARQAARREAFKVTHS